MDEYPKHITVGGQTYEAMSAAHEAELRGGTGVALPADDVPEPSSDEPDPDAEDAPDLDESAEPDAPARKKPGPKGGKKK